MNGNNKRVESRDKGVCTDVTIRRESIIVNGRKGSEHTTITTTTTVRIIIIIIDQ